MRNWAFPGFVWILLLPVLPFLGDDPSVIPDSKLAVSAGSASSMVQSGDEEKIRRRYGSRFLCEATVGDRKTKLMFYCSMVGMAGGMLAVAPPAGSEQRMFSGRSILGGLGGGLAGMGLGWLISRWLAPRCDRIPWEPGEESILRKYQDDHLVWEQCGADRRLKLMAWGMGGALIGAVIAGVAVSRINDPESRAWAALALVPLGGWAGYAGGTAIGRSRVSTCPDEPRPGMYQFRWRQPMGVPESVTP